MLLNAKMPDTTEDDLNDNLLADNESTNVDIIEQGENIFNFL